MNYLSILMVFSGLFLSTNVDKPNKINFEKLIDVDPSFVEFLSHFESTNLPYEMTLDEVIETTNQKVEYGSAESKFLNDYLNKKIGNRTIRFSRSGPPHITPLKRFYPTEKTIAVSYLKKGIYHASGAIMIVIFDLKGKILSFKEEKMMRKLKGSILESSHAAIPLSNNHYNITETFNITQDGMIYKTQYDNIWKKDTKEYGFHDNEIIDRKLASQETLTMNADGSITSIELRKFSDIADVRP